MRVRMPLNNLSKTCISYVFSLSMLFVIVLVILSFNLILTCEANSSEKQANLNLVEIVQINIEEVYAGRKSQILNKNEIMRWLSYVYVPINQLVRDNEFGVLNIDIEGKPLSAQYGKGSTLYTGAIIKGTLNFDLYGENIYFKKFEVHESPPNTTSRLSAKSIHDAPFDPLAKLVVHAAMAHMVGELYGADPLISVLTSENTDEQRGAAAEALGSVDSVTSLEPLVGMLNEYGPPKKKFIRIAAAQALGRIGDQRVVGALIEKLEEKEFSFMNNSFFNARRLDSRFVRQAAAKALNEITGEDYGMNQKAWKNWWEKAKNIK